MLKGEGSKSQKRTDVICEWFPSSNPPEKSCLYVSNKPIWSFEDNDKSFNYAQEACQTLGMELAQIENELEDVALQELTSMNIH